METSPPRHPFAQYVPVGSEYPALAQSYPRAYIMAVLDDLALSGGETVSTGIVEVRAAGRGFLGTSLKNWEK